ncbi:MAG TPA: hypothetical protein VNV87_06820 [Acidimicrobiales bacterium]|jgi:hypothetical protein|nr:hypothetical protein [Acidimicrobiales bacterium]
MSNSAAVRFPDGSVRYGVYDPTEETMWPPLFATIDEARVAWTQRGAGGDSAGGGDGTGGGDQRSSMEVKIFTDFDGGFWWVGEATESRITLGATWAGLIGSVEDVEWDDEPRTRHREMPEWAREALSLEEKPT